MSDKISIPIVIEKNTKALGDVAKELRELDSAVSTSTKNITALKNAFGASMVGVGAAAVVGGLKDAVLELTEYGGRMSDLSAKTGQSVRALQEFNYAGRLVGVSVESIASASSKLQVNLVNNADKFDKFGLSAERLRRLAPEEQLEAIGAKVRAIADPAQQSAMAVELLGKGGAEVLPLLKSDLAAAADEAERLGVVLDDKTVAAADATGDAMDRLKMATSAFSMTLVSLATNSGDAASAIDDIAYAIGRVTKGMQDNPTAVSWLTRGALAVGTMGASESLFGGARLGRQMREEDFLNYKSGPSYKGFDMPTAADFLDPTPLSLGEATPEQKARAAAYRKELQAAEQEKQQKQARIDSLLADLAQRDAIDARRLPGMTRDITSDLGVFGRRDLGFGMAGGADLTWLDPERQITAAESAANAAEAAAKQEAAAAKEAAKWTAALQGVALVAGAVGGRFGEMIDAVGSIGASMKDWKTMSGEDRFGAIASGVGQIGGIVGGRAGGAISGAAGGAMTGFSIGGPVGAVVGGLAGGILGLFGHDKKKEEEERKAREEFDKFTASLTKQYGSISNLEREATRYGVSLDHALDTKSTKELQSQMDELAKRTAGMRSAVEGLGKVIGGLSYTDAAGELQQTFSDPSVVSAVAGSFSTTFWAAFQRQGIGALDAMRGQFGQLLGDLEALGLDPTALGLGRIGDLMTATDDPKTRALLQVTEGSAQALNGLLDAQILNRGELENQTTVARAAYKELQAQGLDATIAAQAMQNDLVALGRAYQAAGEQLPADLQAAMAAAGIEVLPSQLDVLREIRDILRSGGGRSGGGGSPYADAFGDTGGDYGDGYGRSKSFAGGSPWRDWGAGTPAMLHNVEAIVRPGDPVPSGLAGGSTSVVESNTFHLELNVQAPPTGATPREWAVMLRRALEDDVEGIGRTVKRVAQRA